MARHVDVVGHKKGQEVEEGNDNDEGVSAHDQEGNVLLGGTDDERKRGRRRGGASSNCGGQGWGGRFNFIRVCM